MKPVRICLLVLLSTLAYGGEKVLHSFQGSPDGSTPLTGLVADQSGHFYGTTQSGGTGSCIIGGVSGCGTVFELSPDGHGGWTETALYRFTGGVDGQWPKAAMIIDNEGNLYGTSVGLGGNSCSPTCGSVFELSPGPKGWTFTLLHPFTGGRDGGIPYGGVVMDSAGRLYGTTLHFGPKGFGTTFQLTNSGSGSTLKNLHSFTGGSDGAAPCGSLVLTQSVVIYGTANGGGSNGGGVFYRLSLDKNGKWKENVLYSFATLAGGILYGLSSDQNGNLYTSSIHGYGKIFQLSMNVKGQWNKKTLYSFRALKTKDGCGPSGTVLVDQNGNVYGNTTSGGASGRGTLYKLTPQHDVMFAETIMYSFVGSNGESPYGEPVMDENGNLYGSTQGGGPCCGNVFEFTP